MPPRDAPIDAAATSVAAFIGWSLAGPTDRAELVTSTAGFERLYGARRAQGLLADAVAHFFANGGQRAYVVRLTGAGAALDPVAAPAEFITAGCLAETSGTGGLFLLDRVDSFNILCVPGLSDATALANLQRYCRQRRAFLIADCASTETVASLADGPARVLTGDAAENSAFYFPWLTVADAQAAGGLRAVPPCGFVAGLYARTDATRGVWRAPAGIAATLNGASGVTIELAERDFSLLNPRGINSVRVIPGRGVAVWGARTLHGDDRRGSEWKYISVRRLALFIEESVARGLQWTQFEPNDEPLWARIRANAEAFMLSLFRDGALQGMAPREGYFVKCDRSTTTPAGIDQGIVTVVIGFAPLKPAEFVVLTLQQLAGHRRPDDP